MSHKSEHMVKTGDERLVAVFEMLVERLSLIEQTPERVEAKCDKLARPGKNTIYSPRLTYF